MGSYKFFEEYNQEVTDDLKQNYLEILKGVGEDVDREGIIVYHGELDPSHISNRLMPTGSSLRHAIDLALVNKTIDWDPNPSFGCSVKWKN